MSNLIYQYGYNPKDLNKKIYTPDKINRDWGYFSEICEEKYLLQKIFIKKGLTCKPENILNFESHIYLEEGSCTVEVKNSKAEIFELNARETISMPGEIEYNIIAKEDSSLYVFSDNSQQKSEHIKKLTTFDRRYKDYAENCIETIVDNGCTGKKIFFKKGNSSSLHFHCRKTETYFIHSGKLFLRLRAGQGEDKFFILEPGQAIDITPGLMHQAGGIEDVIIIEASTPDDDADSFIVEGEKGEMPKLKEMIEKNINK